MKKIIILFMILTTNVGCAKMEYKQTVDNISIERYMGKWYVIAGRFTYFEDGQHNSIENYTWNSKKERIDVEYFYNKDSFDGKIKKINQKAWIQNSKTNAHWLISPMWPFKFDYLVIALADDYSWTAIGVPSQKYLWIMSREWKMSEEQLNKIIEGLKQKGYNTQDIEVVPQKW
jgi:apolipoprotein D and lipocalin family protein